MTARTPTEYSLIQHFTCEARLLSDNELRSALKQTEQELQDLRLGDNDDYGSREWHFGHKLAAFQMEVARRGEAT